MAFIHGTEAAYAAGILDGEGTIIIDARFRKTQEKVYHRLRVQVVNTHIGVLEFFSKRWEGATWTQTGPSRNGIKHGNRDVFCVVWSGKKAVALLEDIKPYLVIKRRQADLAIEFQAAMESLGRAHDRVTPDVIEDRDIFRDRISRLNRGVA